MTGSDAEVIGRSIANPPSFGAVFDRYGAVLFRFFVRRVGADHGEALLAETFRIAFERRATFDPCQASARPWLYGIASNLVAKHRRAEGRRLRATVALAARVVASAGGDPAEPVAARVDACERWPRVAAALAALPAAERDALLLFAWEELTYEEIAHALEVPVGTVRSRIHRARRRLRTEAGRDGEEEATA